MLHRHEKMQEAIMHETALFLNTISNRTSLITVTRAEVSETLRTATIFVSVLPEEKEIEVLHFLERNAGDLRTHLGKRIKFRHIPYITFERENRALA